jgi:hypothetical protein
MANEANRIYEGVLYIGLAGLQLHGGGRIEFPRGIVLEQTFAHLMAPITMAFNPLGPSGYHPAPWKAARGGFGLDNTAQRTIPKTAADTLDERVEVATAIAFLASLERSLNYNGCGREYVVDAIREAPDAVAHIFPLQFRLRSFQLVRKDETEVLDSLVWVIEHTEITLKLMRESPEFRLAAYALENGQFIENTALTLISLWGGLEALFSPSTAELRFRVSALIASYTNPPGRARLDAQKRIAALYDKRSAAAPGAPKHDRDDLLAIFELLRTALITLIRDGRVPSKQELESRLFGVP